jgi:hypothetical protein
MEEATQELRTEAIQMPNDFAVVAVFLESEKIGRIAGICTPKPFLCFMKKGSLTTCILYNIP